MLYTLLAVTVLLASSATAHPVLGSLSLIRIPISKNPHPFTFSSLVKERTLLQTRSGTAPSTNEGSLVPGLFFHGAEEHRLTD
jgi:hypothetical protein